MNNRTIMKNSILCLTALLLCAYSLCSCTGSSIPESEGDVNLSGAIIHPIERIDVNVDGASTPLGSTGTGTHGGHESRVVRTEHGTFATYITDNYPDDDYDFSWDVFSVIKLNEGIDEVIFSADYPHANGSCTPNILYGSDGLLYVTVVADDKPKYYSANFTREGAWLDIYAINPVTYEVKTYSHRPDFDIIWVGGYGYSQPILDSATGKLYALYSGGDIPGYLAWFVLDLETGDWDPVCHTANIDYRLSYFNAYPDQNGGFFFIGQRDVQKDNLAKHFEITFSSTGGYIWDALYFGHVKSADNAAVELSVLEEYPYQTGMTDVDPPVNSHYGNGCTYLSENGDLHVVYTSIADGKRNTIHAIYQQSGDSYVLAGKCPLDLGDRFYTYAMCQGACGDLYLIAEDNERLLSERNGVGSKRATLEIFRLTDDGLSFEQFLEPTILRFRNGLRADTFYKLSFSSTRNGSLSDGTVDLLFFDTENRYFHFAITLP